MSVKDHLIDSSYVIYVEDDELDFILLGEVTGPHFINIKFSFDYWMLGSSSIIANNKRTLNRRSVMSSKRLSIINGVYIKNLGIPGIRNDLRYRRTRSRYNNIKKRCYSSVIDDKQLKGFSNNIDNKAKPEGIAELSKLLKKLNNMSKSEIYELKIMDYVKDVNVLKTAYLKVIESHGITYGEKPIINDLFFERLNFELGTGSYQCKPSKRIYIYKSNGGKRPLGIPTLKDKIVQEAIKMILEPIYENIFLDVSFGFRPKLGTHAALNYLKLNFTSSKWFIEGDISKCFDTLDHRLIILKIKSVVNEPLLIQTLYKILKAGYIYNKSFSKTNKGVPQGSILGPLLNNIYLHELDIELMQIKTSFDLGCSRNRNRNPEYTKALKSNRKNLFKISPYPKNDKTFKRLKYVRYADDFVIGIIGSKDDCIYIKELIKKKLSSMQLELNDENTKIKNASHDGTLFLGYYIRITPLDKKPIKVVEREGTNYKVRINTIPQLNIPFKYLIKKLKEKGIIRFINNGKRIVGKAVNIYTVYDLSRIVITYSGLFRGISNYYKLANNYSVLHHLNYILWSSCALTLAKKLKLRTISKVIKKFGKNLEVDKNIRYNYKIKAKRNSDLSILFSNTSDIGDIDKWVTIYLKRYYKVNSLLKSECKICETKENLTIHHINKLSSEKSVSNWDRLHQMHNRRQIVLCSSCHWKVHTGVYDNNKSYKH